MTIEPVSLILHPLDEDVRAKLDAILATLKGAMLASKEVCISVSPPRTKGFGANKLVGQATFWFEFPQPVESGKKQLTVC